MAARRPPLALSYHGVGDVTWRRDPDGLFVRSSDLMRHVAILRRWGYEMLTFSEWAARVAVGGGSRAATMTFDDGFVDTLESVVPLLGADAIPATVFVVSSWLGQRHPDTPHTRILTAAELRDVRAAGFEVGGHTRTHVDLTTVDELAARAELADGREELEAILGEEITVAAYPYGRATATTVRACAAAGFRAACRTNGQGVWSEPLNLPRQRMSGRGSRLGLLLKRSGRYETIAGSFPLRELLAAVHASRGRLAS
ncbi:MAG: polysaccharide deacetylase family protein [Solirubrobacteraceae bacterium]